ncbi:MAG: serine/threonine-protein kinase [Vicinamibacterales bacterium]
MSSTPYDRVKAILVEALALAPDAREDFLQRACGGDEALRDEVASLLAHQDDGQSPFPPLLATGGAGALVALATAPEPAGRLIGPYELLGVLGEGGMGTVYHARQHEPLSREVALKLVKRGLDSARIVARFEAERQTLARLDHTGIARILDAGTADDGRPYFVMELVRGVPVTAYADAHRLTVRDRLALFQQICQAVQHAHQKGVLHRDLKPSNILVAEEDGVARPKVIDFGIAKAIEPGTDGGTLATEAGLVVGTPEYMSPEQAGVRPGGADTRSDVYSLGVLLFELLTGQRPLSLQGLHLNDAQALIATSEPERPSIVVSSSAPDRIAIGRARQSTPARLAKTLAGDLDNILLMSLRKEPERRYAGVDQFAADIARYLDGQPVIARPDTWTYRAGKFTRRHRVSVAVAASLMAAVGFGGVMTRSGTAPSWPSGMAADAATSKQVSDFLVGLFNEADPYVSQGAPLTARAVLDQGAERIERDLADQPEVQAALMATMSRAYTGLRVPDRASGPRRTRPRDRARAAWGPSHAHVATALFTLANAESAADDHEASEPLYREALAMRRALLPPDDPATLESISLYALDLQTLARHDEAEPLYREALAMTRRIFPESARRR